MTIFISKIFFMSTTEFILCYYVCKQIQMET